MLNLKPTFLIFAFTIFNYCLFSQTKKEFVENFDSNTTNWLLPNNTNQQTAIKAGYYVIEQNSTDAKYDYTQNLGLDLTQDFKVETAIKCYDGDVSRCYSLALNFQDWSNNLLIKLTPSGLLSVVQTKNNEESVIVQPKRLKIYSDTGFNKIKVEQLNGLISFYLNDKSFYQDRASSYSFFSTQIGWVVEKNLKIKVDYLKLAGVFKTINVSNTVATGLIKENLGDKINSIYSEVHPTISTDGKTLYINRKNHPSNTASKEDNDDVWLAKFSNGNWGELKNIGKPINNEGHNFIVSVSADNNVMYLNGTYLDNGAALGGGLSITKRTQTGWEIPKPVFIYDYYNLNRFVSAAITQDNKVLILGIERKDGKGDQDLHVSFLKEDGSYTQPKNMGSIINTAGGDATPFISADNKTLYFASNGHPGYGDYDVFVTRRLDDTWLNWSTPENLGPEINSKGWDAYFTIPANGEYAYMVSSENSIGQEDVIRLKVPEKIKPNPVVLVKGKTLNKTTLEHLSTVIRYIDLTDNSEAGKAISNPANGDYSIVLQYGKKYAFRAEKEGFYAINDYVDLTNISTYQEIEKNLLLAPIEVGQIIRLNNIFFDFDKATLKTESYEELNRLVKFLNENPTVEIEIAGHTDDVGADDYNLKLSQQRTESVVNYLVEKTISKVRLKAVGFGEKKPLMPNTSDQNREVNRRVEFTILKK